MSEEQPMAPGTEHLRDIARYGEPFLRDGIKTVLERGYALTGGDIEASRDPERIDRWYEGLVGRVPAKYWKELSIRAATRKPYYKFTFGQFMEAWEGMKNTGEAPGYLQV